MQIRSRKSVERFQPIQIEQYNIIDPNTFYIETFFCLKTPTYPNGIQGNSFITIQLTDYDIIECIKFLFFPG